MLSHIAHSLSKNGVEHSRSFDILHLHQGNMQVFLSTRNTWVVPNVLRNNEMLRVKFGDGNHTFKSHDRRTISFYTSSIERSPCGIQTSHSPFRGTRNRTSYVFYTEGPKFSLSNDKVWSEGRGSVKRFWRDRRWTLNGYGGDQVGVGGRQLPWLIDVHITIRSLFLNSNIHQYNVIIHVKQSLILMQCNCSLRDNKEWSRRKTTVVLILS